MISTACSGPAGLLDSFFQTNLLNYVDMSVQPLALAYRTRLRLGFSRTALQVFQDAATIRQAFFPTDGGKTMLIHFQLSPMYLRSLFARDSISRWKPDIELPRMARPS